MCVQSGDLPRTFADDIQVESRGVERKYFLRRPRALQYRYREQVIAAADETGGPLPPVLGIVNQQVENGHGHESHHVPEHHHDEHHSDLHTGHNHHHHEPISVKERRERLDLFIDLIWVGIISNLSEVFSGWYFSTNKGQWGEAVGVFILIFLPSWRIWNSLREFMNDYYMDDLLQRMFIFWILLLSVFYGNNIAYLEGDGESIKIICIVTYALIRWSFMCMELYYSIYIPWLRRLIIVGFLAKVPSIGLWMGAIWIKGWAAAGPAAAAIMCEYWVPFMLETSWASKLVAGEYRKAVDAHHFVTRMGNFFIIIIGEGVLQLIKGGPLNIGLNATTSLLWPSLTIYFLYTFMYFGKDQSKYYIPAIKRPGMWPIAWIAAHIPLFSNFLTLVAGIMFIIRQSPAAPLDGEAERYHGAELLELNEVAKWDISVSLAIIVVSMTLIHLCDRPLDPPGTLKVNDRRIRLAVGRIPYITIVLCLPIKETISIYVFMGIIAFLTIALTMWEMHAAMEPGGGFFEPRGLTMLMSSELKGKGGGVVGGGHRDGGEGETAGAADGEGDGDGEDTVDGDGDTNDGDGDGDVEKGRRWKGRLGWKRR